jgi:hypothetical protein
VVEHGRDYAKARRCEAGATAYRSSVTLNLSGTR